MNSIYHIPSMCCMPRLTREIPTQQQNPVKMGFVNVGERFGEVGNLKYLSSAFGFTADNVAQKAKELLGK